MYSLSEEAKGYIKAEFKQFETHILLHKKVVNAEMAKILKELQVVGEKESKLTPVVQPTGSRPPVYEVDQIP